MKGLAYPLQHVSIRVPWHDGGWNGTVCSQPRHNTACLKLINIAESKVEADEELIKGQTLQGMAPSRFPPCVKERATFMAPFALDRFHEHPYVKTSQDTHAHFKLTRLHYPAYAAAKGTLIVTRDQADGGIDSPQIASVIAQVFRA